MALVKQITVKGVTLEYWVVTHLHWDIISNTTNVRLSPFASKAVARREVNGVREGLNYAFFEASKEFTLPGFANRANAYDAIKLTDWAQGAADDVEP